MPAISNTGSSTALAELERWYPGAAHSCSHSSNTSGGGSVGSSDGRSANQTTSPENTNGCAAQDQSHSTGDQALHCGVARMLAGRPGIKVVKSEGGEESGGVIKAGSPYNGSSGTSESTPSGSDYTPTDHTDQTESEDMMVYYCLFESKSFCPPFPPHPLWHALPFASCFRPCVELRWTCSLGLDVALFHQSQRVRFLYEVYIQWS